MSEFPARMSDWTIADVQRKLKSMGAVITHCSQNLNRKHFPQQFKEWSCHLMTDPDIEVDDPRWKLVTGRGKTIEIALARAIQKWNEEPDLGETLRLKEAFKDASRPKRASLSSPEAVQSGLDLLKKLGL